MIWALRRQILTSRDSNFNIFLRTYTFKRFERRINEINRTQNNYNKLNIE